MNKSYKAVIGLITVMGLGLASASVYAHSNADRTGGGRGHGMMGDAGHRGAQPGSSGTANRQSLMTPEERTAFRDKMHKAATPEERRKIAETTRAEMQKRAQEKGVKPRESHAQRGGHGHQRHASWKKGARINHPR